MDCLHFIKSHHDAIRDAFAVLLATDGVKIRRAMVDDLARDVHVYVALEKEYLYPEVGGLFPGGDSVAAAGVANGAAITRRTKALKALAAKPANEQEDFQKRLRELHDSVLKHFDQEEQILMPKIRAMIRTEDREDLGQVFLEVKTELLASLATDATGARGRKRA